MLMCEDCAKCRDEDAVQGENRDWYCFPCRAAATGAAAGPATGPASGTTTGLAAGPATGPATGPAVLGYVATGPAVAAPASTVAPSVPGPTASSAVIDLSLDSDEEGIKMEAGDGEAPGLPTDKGREGPGQQGGVEGLPFQAGLQALTAGVAVASHGMDSEKQDAERPPKRVKSEVEQGLPTLPTSHPPSHPERLPPSAADRMPPLPTPPRDLPAIPLALPCRARCDEFLLEFDHP